MSQLNDALQRLEQRAAQTTGPTTVRIDPPTRLARGLRGPTVRRTARGDLSAKVGRALLPVDAATGKTPRRTTSRVTQRKSASVIVADTHRVVASDLESLAITAYEVGPSTTLLGEPLTVIADGQVAFLSVDVDRNQSGPWEEEDKVDTPVKEVDVKVADTHDAKDVGDADVRNTNEGSTDASATPRRHHTAHASPRPSSAFLTALAEARPSEPPAERSLSSQTEREDVATDDMVIVTRSDSQLATPERTVPEAVVRSQVAKDIQAVATSLLRAIPHGQPATLLFTSAEASDSLSRVLSSLLIAMAEQREDPVLAINASGNRELERRFHSTRKKPSLNILPPKPTKSTTSAWHETIIQTSVPGLCLLTPDFPESPIDPRDIPQGMEDLHTRFGLVIVAAASVDDAALRMWAPSCGGSYLLLRSQSLSWHEASTLRHRMSQIGTDLFGCVLVVG